MVINIFDVWEAATTQHYDFLNSEIDKGLNGLSDSFIDVEIKDFIESNRRIIVSGAPSELIECITDYEVRFGDGVMQDCVSQRIKEIISYENFSKKSNEPWTAYHLCLLAKYKVCCYCHMVSTGTCLPNEDVKGYRPPIDHYYTKSDYPYFALTLSNFIPCCEKCNGSQMKHSVDFAKDPHLNPFLDTESIEFSLRPLAIDEDFVANALTLKLPPENYCLIVEAKCNHEISNKSIRTFQLESRYEEYSSQAFYFARSARNFAARKKMFDDALDIEMTLCDVLEFEPNSYKKTAYGKARICIAKQYGAISD